MEILTVENAHLRMRVTPQGGMVLSLDALACQQPVLRPGAGLSPGDCGLFPMLPLANRVAGNHFTLKGRNITLPQSAIDSRFFLHGDGWSACWQVVEQSHEHCVLQMRSSHPCGFDYQATLRYTLQGPEVVIMLSLTHLGRTAMLYGGGVHPFFSMTPDSRIQFTASGYWPEGELHLPLVWHNDIPAEADFSVPGFGSDRWLNVCYSGWNGRVRLQHPAMVVTMEASANANWLMLFRMEGEPFVCLEPQSHPVNAHHMPGQPGLVLLSEGESWHFSTRIHVTPADNVM